MAHHHTAKKEFRKLVKHGLTLYSKDVEKFKSVLKKQIFDLVTKSANSHAINENDLSFIDPLVDKLAEYAKTENSKNLILKWLENIVNYVRGKNPIERESIEVTKVIENLAAKELQAAHATKNSKFILEEVKKYDLLDNLSDHKKIEALNKDDLKILYKLSMTDALLNCYVDSKYSISSIFEKIEKSIKDNKPIDRQEMLDDIKAVLKEKDPTELPNAAEINRIKAIAAERSFVGVESQYKYFKNNNADNTLVKELGEIKDQIKELKDHYLFKEIIADVISQIDLNKNKIPLLELYTEAKKSFPLQALEEDLLSQCKNEQHLADQLNNYKNIEAFQTKLIAQLLKSGKISGHVKAAAPSKPKATLTKQQKKQHNMRKYKKPKNNPRAL